MSTLTPPTTLTAARQLRLLPRPSVPGFNFDFYLDRHTGFAFVPNCLFGGQQHSFPGNLKGFCGLVTALLSRSSLRGHVGENMSTASGSVPYSNSTPSLSPLPSTNSCHSSTSSCTSYKQRCKLQVLKARASCAGIKTFLPLFAVFSKRNQYLNKKNISQMKYMFS